MHVVYKKLHHIYMNQELTSMHPCIRCKNICFGKKKRIIFSLNALKFVFSNRHYENSSYDIFLFKIGMGF